MSVLSDRVRMPQSESIHAASDPLISTRPFRPGLIGQCANPGCRSGWLHLFRNRATPIFEEAGLVRRVHGGSHAVGPSA